MSERTSYLTADEVEAAQALHKRAPYSVCNVSQGFFSIARHYGGMTLQDCHYTYMPEHDECVRDDVLKLVKKLRKTRKAGQCRKCGGAMQPGIAFEQTYIGGAPDMGEVCTMSPGGPGKVVECEKCSVCGWSVTP